MAYVLHRDDSVIVALDDREDAPYLIVTLFDEAEQTDKLLASVRLPATGIEIISYSEGERERQEPESTSVEWTGPLPLFRQRRPA